MEFYQKVSKVGLWGIIGNIFLLIIKSIVGLLFSSQAMIADAMNSAMDIFASFMTTMGGKIAASPRDEDHHFGHGKAEFVFAFLVSLSMMLGAFFIFKDSFIGLIKGHNFEFSYLLIIVCCLTILVKVILYFFALKIYNETDSLLVKSNMLDHRNDVLVTSCTLISIILGLFQITFVDSLVGLGISLWIFYSGFKIFMESYYVLMDKALEENISNEIERFILSQDGIMGVTKFETIPAGNRYLLILSILVDGNLNTFDSHAIADKLEKIVLKKYSEILAVTIHVNPVKKQD